MDFFEKYKITGPHAAVGGLLAIMGIFCFHSLVGSWRAAALNDQEVKRERALKEELRTISEQRVIAEAENAIPDSYSMKIHEWDCSTGSLIAPVRTLGNPKLSYTLPMVEPRLLTDSKGVPVAKLTPEATVDYSLALTAGCPMVDEPFELFSNPVPVDFNQPQPQLGAN